MVIYMFEWQRLIIVQAVYTSHLLTKSMLKFLHANSECSVHSRHEWVHKRTGRKASI